MNSLAHDKSYVAAIRKFKDAIFPCDWVGTGCLAIHRTVFEDMMAKFPNLAPSSPGRPWNFFHPLEDGSGEDKAFCTRARSIGFQPYVDTMLQVLHVGWKCYGLHTSNVMSGGVL